MTMTPGTLKAALDHLRGLSDARPMRELADCDLLERFHDRREEDAFAALVERHGPLVWGVCRRVLHDLHLAEDAFQATFLVLLRKAGSVRKRGSVGSFLHGVAYRVSLKARIRAHATRAQERRYAEMRRPDPPDHLALDDLWAVLDEELGMLPEKYRTPVILCYLEGQTQDQAARQLGCPRTSISSRLGRARALLHGRLARRGLALSAGLLATALAGSAAAEGVPAAVLLSAVRAGTSGAVSPSAAALAQEALQTMTATRLIVASALVLILAAGVATLGRGDPPQARLALAPSGDAAPAREESPLFRDVTPGSGIDFTYRNGEEAQQFTPLESLGGGVALIDYDGDGLLDVFLTGGGTFAGADRTQIQGRPCKLYKNLGNGKFKDVTREVGLDGIAFYTHGAAVADYDRDGWPDLLVTGYGQVALWHNETDGKGGRRFVDVTGKARLSDNLWSTSAAWADFDGDGWPDLYVCHYVAWSFKKNPHWTYDGKTRDICPPKAFKAQPHRVYRNNGDGTFTDVSKEAGLRGDGKGLGVVVADLDGDGKPDLFVANDTTDQFLYANRSTPGKVRFVEVGRDAGVARDWRGATLAGRGVAAGDYNNTGRPSLLLTGYEDGRPTLFRNDSKGGMVRFSDASAAAGLARLAPTDVGWGVGFFDVDLDGRLDLFIANGHLLRHPDRQPAGAPGGVGKQSVAQRPVLLRNEGAKWTDVADQGGPYFQKDHRGRGVAFGDLDNDGRIDLVISHLNEPVVLLRNEAKRRSNHWLGVELKGKRHGDVTGARLVLEVEGRPAQTRHATAGGSFASSSDPRHVFGVGAAKRVGKLTVRWPSGKEQSWEGLAIDRYWRLVEGEVDAQAPDGKGAGR
jgi:RNA polymerase sigma factor (sigma-70 family)